MKPNSKKVFLVVHDLSYVLSHHKAVVKELSHAGVVVSIFGFRGSKKYREALRANFENLEDIEFGGDLMAHLRLFCLFRSFSGFNNTIVFIGCRACFVYPWLASTDNNSVVCFYSGLGFASNRSFGSFLVRLGCRLGNRAAEKLIFQNGADPLTLGERHPLIIIPGAGVDFQNIKRTPEVLIEKWSSPFGEENPLKVVCISRLIKSKGIHLAVEAFKELGSNFGRHVELTIVGEFLAGRHDSYSSAEINHLQSHPCIRFLGFSEDVRSILLESHLMVFPSEREGMPRVVVEALGFGCLVIGFDVPGVKDILSNMKRVVCVKKDIRSLVDSSNRMVQELLEMTDMHLLQLNIIENAIAVHENYSSDYLSKEIAKVYMR